MKLFTENKTRVVCKSVKEAVALGAKYGGRVLRTEDGHVEWFNLRWKATEIIEAVTLKDFRLDPWGALENPFSHPAYLDMHGVWRLASNNLVPPDDVDGWDKLPELTREHCTKVRDEELRRFLAKQLYRATDEARAT